MNKMPLTPKTKETLDFIISYKDRWGFAPTIEEIRKAFHLKSIGSAFERVESLIDRGYLKRYALKARALEVL